MVSPPPRTARSLAFLHLSGPRRGRLDNVSLPAFIGSEAGADVLVPEIGAAPRLRLRARRRGGPSGRGLGAGHAASAGRRVRGDACCATGDVIRLVRRNGPPLRFGASSAWPPGAGALRRPELSRGRCAARACERRGAPPPALAGVAFLAACCSSGGHSGRPTGCGSKWAAARGPAAGGGGARPLLRADRGGAREGGGRPVGPRARMEDPRAGGAALGSWRRRRGRGARRAKDLVQTRERLASLETERAVGERIIREYGHGVCLIQGAYAFYDEDGRPLRYRLDESRDDAGRGRDARASIRRGPGPCTVEYFGTGFLVDRGGLVLTNRHVAEPWWNDAAAEALQARLQAALHPLPRVLPAQERALRARRRSALRDGRPGPGARGPAAGASRRCPSTGAGGRGARPAGGGGGLPRRPRGDAGQGGAGVVKEMLVARHELRAHDRGAAPAGADPPLDHPGPHRRRDRRATSCSTRPPPRGAAAGRCLNKEGQVIAVEYAVLSEVRGQLVRRPHRLRGRAAAPPRRPGSADKPR